MLTEARLFPINTSRSLGSPVGSAEPPSFPPLRRRNLLKLGDDLSFRKRVLTCSTTLFDDIVCNIYMRSGDLWSTKRSDGREGVVAVKSGWLKRQVDKCVQGGCFPRGSSGLKPKRAGSVNTRQPWEPYQWYVKRYSVDAATHGVQAEALTMRWSSARRVSCRRTGGG